MYRDSNKMSGKQRLSSVQFDTKHIRKSKTNFLNYREGVVRLMEHMKIYEQQNSTRNLDHTRMNIANNIEALECETDFQKDIQSEGRAYLDVKLEKNDNHLGSLLNRAQELLNNVNVENERWTLKRHKADMENRMELQQKVHMSAMLAEAEYKEIISRFSELEEVQDTLNLNEQLTEQKDKILQLMDAKDALIKQCKNEVKYMNEVYFDSFETQNLNIILLIERINAAVDVANQAYNQAVDDYEEKLQVESNNLQSQLQAKTESNIQKTFDFIGETKDALMKKFSYYMDQLKIIQYQQEDMTRVINIQLQLESDDLLRQMIQERTSMLMNSEKLDYNLQIVKSRNDETLILINQHKRTAARYATQTNRMLKKLEILSKKVQQDCTKLTKDTIKLKELIADMHGKTKKLRVANKRNFDNIWNLNYQEVLKLIQQILSIDRMLSEFLCNIEYEPPNIDLTNINEEPNKKKVELPRKSKAEKLTNSFENHMLRGLLRGVLKQISERGGMLVESTLQELLKQYGEKNERLVRIENVFKALAITNGKLIDRLNIHFRNYAWCPNCASGLPDDVIHQLLGKRVGDYTNNKDIIRIEQKECANHYLVTEQTFVFTILNDFLKKLCINPNHKSLVEEIYTAQPNLIKLDKDKISGFFLNLLNYFNDTELKHWKIMEHALAHYMLTLRRRVKLHDEVHELKKQNLELQHLLSGL